MPSSPVSGAADLPPPQLTKPSSSGVDDDDEVEYEEIEVEEEVEGVEEIETEEDEDEIGEDLTPIREENRQKDTSRVMEPEEHLTSGSMTPGIPIANPQQHFLAIEESSGNFIVSESSETRPKDEPCLNGERTSKESDQKPLPESEGIDELKTKSSGGFNAALSKVDSTKKVNVDHVVEENVQTAEEAARNFKQMPSRLDAPHIRPRDLYSPTKLSGESKRPRIICEFHAKGWCIKGKSCRFVHIKEGDVEMAKTKSEFSAGEASSVAHLPTQESGEHPKLNSVNYSHHTSPLVRDSYSNFRDTTFHGDFSSCSSISDTYRSTGISSYWTGIEGMIDQRSQFRSHDCGSRGLNHYLSRPQFSLSSSSWNTDVLPIRKLPESSLHHYASLSSSLRRSYSSFSGSESESFSRNNVLGDADHSARYKTNVSSDDWEPSVPFRPSHSITQKLLFKEHLYDPIRHSIEQTTVGNRDLNSSFSDQGESTKNTHLQSNKSQEAEKALNSIHGKDINKVSRSGSDSRPEGDGSRTKAEPKVEEVSQNNDHEIDLQMDLHMQKESKALKYFQTALVDFIKELVKPTWREGLLSRDAFKLIVKKAVDKVLSTLQPDQIPSTDENVSLYLSMSQPKLVKLVEGYIEKYGKS